MAMSVSPEEVRTAVVLVWAARFSFAANLTVQVYSCLTTLDQEFYLYKNAKSFSLMKALFILNRYIPFGNTIMDFYTFLIADPREDVCNRLIAASTYLVSLQFIVAEYVLFYRACAIWRNNKYVVALSLVTLLVTSALGLFYGHDYAGTVMTRDIGLAAPGCIVLESGSVTRELILITTTEVVSLLLFAAQVVWSSYASAPGVRKTVPDVMKMMFKDGVAYFLCIIVICSANTVSNVLSQTGSTGAFHAALLPIQATMQNVLCIRLLLHVRLANAVAEGYHENELSMMVATTRLSIDLERGRKVTGAPAKKRRGDAASSIVFNRANVYSSGGTESSESSGTAS